MTRGNSRNERGARPRTRGVVGQPGAFALGDDAERPRVVGRDLLGLATLQGGLLLAQVQRDSAPLETALDTLLGLGVRDWTIRR